MTPERHNYLNAIELIGLASLAGGILAFTHLATEFYWTTAAVLSIAGLGLIGTVEIVRQDRRIYGGGPLGAARRWVAKKVNPPKDGMRF